VARISGGQRQKEASLEDQLDHGKSVVQELYPGPSEFEVLSTTGKGERKDRPELKELDGFIRSRKFDVLVAEDLGRIIRGAEAVKICGLAVDHGVRVISPNDCIDTADESWEEDVISACRDHVGHNAHTSKRIKKKLMNRFIKYGGAPGRPIWGYIIPPDAKTYNDWRKDPNATEIYIAWFEKLLLHGNCSDIADWLNAKKVPPGPYAENDRWDGRMVRRVTANSLLKGMPARGQKHTIKQHEYGRRIAVKNPHGPTYFECTHLAHVPTELFDTVNAKLIEQNRGLGRKTVDGDDPRYRVLKKRTRWPGQHILCGVCGRFMYWGGHGQNEHMMCAGVREYACWNTATFDGVVAGAKLIQSFLSVVESLSGYDEAFLAAIQKTVSERSGHRTERLQIAEQNVKKYQRELTNLMDGVARMGFCDALESRVRETETELKQATALRDRIVNEPITVPELPEIEALKAVARRVTDLGFKDLEFCQTMKSLIPKLMIFPYRPRDGGHVVQRAVLSIDLAPLAGDAEFILDGKLTAEQVVDLFDPPQRIQFLGSIVALKHHAKTEREIARELGITQPVVQRAAALHRKMVESGSDDAYESLLEPPDDDCKRAVHLHHRYEFRPLDGYPQVPPELK